MIGPTIDTEDYNELDAILTRFPNLRCVYLNNEPDEIMQDLFKYKCPKISHIYLDKTKVIIKQLSKDTLDFIEMKINFNDERRKMKASKLQQKFGYDYDYDYRPRKKVIPKYENIYQVKIIQLKNDDQFDLLFAN